MRAITAVSFVVVQLFCLAYCTRLIVEPSGTDAPRHQGFETVDPPSVAALQDVGLPRTATRRSPWRLPKALPLLVGAARAAGGSMPSLGLVGEFPRPPRPLTSRTPARSRGGLLGRDAPALARSSFPSPRSQETRPHQALPAALAVRGGAAAIRDEEHEIEIPENLMSMFPQDGWFCDDISVEDSMAILLRGGPWRATITSARVQQMWEFEFFRTDSMYVDIGYYDLPHSERKRGSQRLELSPLEIFGQPIGFTGTLGDTFIFRFTHVGVNLRIDITFPANSFQDASLSLFATPALVELAAISPPPPPTAEFQEVFRQNLFRVTFHDDSHGAPRMSVPVGRLVSLLQKPGRWTGKASGGGLGQTVEWDILFFDAGGAFVCEIVTRNDADFTLTDFTYTSPFYDGDDFKGLRGEGYGVADGSAEYFFTLKSDGLHLEVVYNVDGSGVHRLQTFLEHRPPEI